MSDRPVFKFKVGDRVRMVEGPSIFDSKLKCGEVYTIREIKDRALAKVQDSTSDFSRFSHYLYFNEDDYVYPDYKFVLVKHNYEHFKALLRDV